MSEKCVIKSPSVLRGSVTPPPSKSVAHRALIAASLSPGVSVIRNIALSEDIAATVDCLRALGAKLVIEDNTAAVTGINLTEIPQKALLNCRESGSTLRFLIPVCAALGIEATFTGGGKLPSRPIDTYERELGNAGIVFKKTGKQNLPLTISGKLKSAVFEVEGDISSQYITGLLFALPISGGQIRLKSPLESKGYVDITADVMDMFGVKVNNMTSGYTISGTYKPAEYTVENDWSQAAFWLAAKTVTVDGMNSSSRQSDKKCTEIIEQITDGNGNNETVDVSQIPDLLPILAVVAATSNKRISFTNAKRLVLKESNRLKATADMINALGGEAFYDSESLTVCGTGNLTGGTVCGYNDHRIVMAAAIAAIAAIAATQTTGNVVISDPWSVK
jgi:3-phosphoshikimate 1-carboxyvinyltransferase